MIEVTKNLFVGSQEDLPNSPTDYIISAAKEPFHREAVGYAPGKAAPKGKDYFFVYRDDGKHLILNLIDAPDKKYLPKEPIAEAIKFIEKNIDKHKIFLHCNQGKSRSAAIAFLYMVKKGLVKKLPEFKKIYPPMELGKGFADLLSKFKG